MPNTYTYKGISNPNVPLFPPKVCTLVLPIIIQYIILYLCKNAHALRVSKHVTESIRNIARGVGIN